MRSLGKDTSSLLASGGHRGGSGGGSDSDAEKKVSESVLHMEMDIITSS
jgi:hypothetical protein